MTTTLKEAIAVLRELPEDRQEAIARAILDFGSNGDDAYSLCDEERHEGRAGLAEIERGEIASEAEVHAVYQSIGL